MDTESESDISESEIEEYVEEAYEKLKVTLRELRIMNPDGTLRCPFCAGKKKQDYRYKDLMQHATGIGASNARGAKMRVNHLAFAKYLQVDLARGAPAPAPPQPKRQKISNGLREEDPRYVYPFMAILANAPVNGSEDGDIKEIISKFSICDMQLMCDVEQADCQRGFAVLTFRNDWTGFQDAMDFDEYFKGKQLGRRTWNDEGKDDSRVYGWVARAADYDLEGPVGDHLRRDGILKTIAELQSEKVQQKGNMISDLTKKYDTTISHLNELQSKCDMNALNISMMIKEQQNWQQYCSEAMRQIDREDRENARRVLLENAKLKSELDEQQKRIELQEKELRKKQAESKRKQDENLKNALLDMEWQKADENVQKLMENQKWEIDANLETLANEERCLDERLYLELEIEKLKGQLEVLKCIEGEDVAAIEEKMEQEKEKLDTLTGSLVSKERAANDSLLEMKTELLEAFEKMSTNRPTLIGIKRLGELDEKVFLKACKLKFVGESNDVIQMKAAELCSHWQDIEMKDSSWYPFKTVDDKRVINENDEKLVKLRSELGEEVFMSVSQGMSELMEYNASGGYLVTKLWNFKAGREATIKEAFHYIFKQLKKNKRKKNNY